MKGPRELELRRHPVAPDADVLEATVCFVEPFPGAALELQQLHECVHAGFDAELAVTLTELTHQQFQAGFVQASC